MSEPTAAEEQAAADAMLDAQIDELMMEKYERRIRDNLATPDEDEPLEAPVETEQVALSFPGLSRPQPRTCGTMTVIVPQVYDSSLAKWVKQDDTTVTVFCHRTTYNGSPHAGIHLAEVSWQ